MSESVNYYSPQHCSGDNELYSRAEQEAGEGAEGGLEGVARGLVAIGEFCDEGSEKGAENIIPIVAPREA